MTPVSGPHAVFPGQIGRLEFRAHGGCAAAGDYQQRAVASVRLYHAGQIVRETFGLNRNDRDVNAQWDVSEFAGEWVRLVVADNATGPGTPTRGSRTGSGQSTAATVY